PSSPLTTYGTTWWVWRARPNRVSCASVKPQRKQRASLACTSERIGFERRRLNWGNHCGNSCHGRRTWQAVHRRPSPPFAGSSKSSIVPSTPQCGQVVPRRMGGRTGRNTLPIRSMGSTSLSKGRPREVVPHGGSTLPVVPVPVQRRRWDGLEPVPSGGGRAGRERGVV